MVTPGRGKDGYSRPDVGACLDGYLAETGVLEGAENVFPWKAQPLN
jgi:hypothetical protein